MEINFESFDELIGTDGYYRLIREAFFPNSTEDTFDISLFNAEEKIFRKGAIFSRVRWLDTEKANEFFDHNISINEFYPPRPHVASVPLGRFNPLGQATLYVADHPLVAMKECDIKCGDYFLLSHLSLSSDMCILNIQQNKDELSDLLYNLLQSKDKRFYPVINKVNSEMLNFSKFHGMHYNSTRAELGKCKISGCVIDSISNLAISNKYINKTELEVSWLMQCGQNYKLSEICMFTPASKKKKTKYARQSMQATTKIT
jgi:hypothetical protein